MSGTKVLEIRERNQTYKIGGTGMKNESGSVLSSYLMGVVLFCIGVFVEPLMMVLGGLIIVTGAIAKFVESRRLRFQAMEAEKQEAGLKGKVA